MNNYIFTLTLLFILPFSVNGQSLFELNLDEETARPSIVGDGIFQESGGNLYYLNRISSNIKVFDLKTGNTLSTIPLFKAGPNTVGPQVETFYVLNKDSIFVFSEFFKNRISLISSNGQVINQFGTWPKEIESKYPGSMLSAKPGGIQINMPFVYLAHMIYDLDTRQNHSSISRIDTRNGNVTLLDVIPPMKDLIDITKLADLPDLLSPTIHVAKGSRMAVNYPVSNDIFTFSENEQGHKKHAAKSKKMEPIRMLSKPLTTMGKEQYMRERRDISGLSGYYPNFIYDKFKNIYYRIVRLPYDENVLRRYRQGVSSKLPPHAYSVMALDEDFNILDEWIDEERKFSPGSGFFVDNRGIWILERKIKNEDKMIFQKVEF